MRYFEKISKLTKEDYTDAGIVGGGAVALRAIENKIVDRASSKKDFKSFDDLKAHYADLKTGDTIFYKDTFSRGEGHPVVVADADNYYDWPDEKGWKKGLRAKKVKDMNVTDPKRPYRAKGKIIEAYPGSTVVRTGSLEGMLYENSHVDGKFDPKKARRLGGAYFRTDLDAQKFSKNVKTVESNMSKNLYKYSPFSKSMPIEKGKCGSGTCITFADSLLGNSIKGAPDQRGAHSPFDLLSKLKNRVESRTTSPNKSNFISTLMMLDGGRRFYKGLKNDDSKEVAMGTGEAGAGIALNMSKRLNSASNSIGGFVSQTVGGMATKLPLKAIYKFDNKFKSLKTLGKAIRENPRATGAAVLALPLWYGTKKTFDNIEEKL